MHRFAYKNNQLYCEDTPVADIAARVGTPFYLYSHDTIVDHYTKITKAFRTVKPLICFSMKSNSNLAVLKTLVSRGAGLDIVSGGELYRALLAGCHPKKIVYASVGKKPEEIGEAVRRGILFFNVESLAELEMINSVAGKLKKNVDCAIRINPNVAAGTHEYISTAKIENKFGIDFDTARSIFDMPMRFANVSLSGIHMHIGSQITEAEPFVRSLKKTLKFVDENDISVDWLNIGGGLGIIYSREKPQTAREFAKKIIPLLRGRKIRLILEPGRFIAGNSGILVTKVIYTKENPSGKIYAICDAGMNDLIRPSLYDAYHEVHPVKRNQKPEYRVQRYDIVGPICESGDFLARDRRLPKLASGDLLAVMGAGAYGFTMASNYNSRPRVPEVMVVNGKVHIVRKRETYADLVKGEVIPKGL